MYETFYGLKEKPFTLLPDPDYLYLSPKHQRALTLLEYGMMNQAGFSVICGDTGAGKTTLIRRLLNELGDDTKVGLITNTHQSFGELLNWVLMAFGLDGDGKSKAQMHQMFISFLIEQYADNKHTVLIVDEAQNMGADTLEELRMLSNINADKDQVLQVILAGQPALRETLRKPELMQFAQRIAVDYYLESLSAEETRGYIHHRLKVAGTSESIFTSAACEAIYKYSGGTPRLINLLCDTALVYGFAEQSDIIDAPLVHDVVREQHSNSIIPTFNTDYSTDSDAAEPASHSASQQSVEKIEGLDGDHAAKDKAVQNISANDKLTGLENAVNMSAAIEKEAAGESVGQEETVNAPEEPLVDKKEKDSIVEDEREDRPEGNVSENIQGINESAGEDALKFDEAELEEPADIDRGAQPIAENINNKKEEDSSSIDDSEQPSSYPPVQDVDLQDEAEASSGRHKNQALDDVYPIVHIEEPPRKGLNVVLVGIVAGMFVASIVMMVAAWIMFGGNDQHDERAMLQNLELNREAESRELKVLQKERDAALAVSRALEMERDAAIISAKAKDDMRAAELRAAEILAEQQQKASKLLAQANARARAAKKAEAKALEREREIQRRAKVREIELEAQQQRILRKEKWRLEKLAAEAKAKEQREKQSVRSRVTQPKEVVVKPTVVKPVKPQKEKTSESFSSNPCNSPSAKFLSTCKK